MNHARKMAIRLFFPIILTFSFRVKGDSSFLKLESQNLFLEVETFSFKPWQLRSNVRPSLFEDGNHQEAFDHLISYEILTSPFILRAGLGGGWFRFYRQHPGYWNPVHFNAFGSRIVAIKEFMRSWRIEGRYHINRHQEEGRPVDQDIATELHHHYRNSQNILFKLIRVILNSENGSWWQNHMTLNMEIPL